MELSVRFHKMPKYLTNLETLVLLKYECLTSSLLTRGELRSSVESGLSWTLLLMLRMSSVGLAVLAAVGGVGRGRGAVRLQQITALVWVIQASASSLQKVQFGATMRRTTEIFSTWLYDWFGVATELSHSHRGHGQRPRIAARRPRWKFCKKRP